MSLYGWIVRGKFYESEMYGHIKTLREINTELGIIEMAEFDRRASAIEDSLSDCQAREENGEHPDWHVYEIELTNLQGKFIDSLFSMGALQVGTINHAGYADEMYFEGFREAAKAHAKDAYALAEKYDMRPVFKHRKRYKPSHG